MTKPNSILRRTLRQKRNRLSLQARQRFDSSINSTLLSTGILLRSPRIAGYLANDGEPSIEPFIYACFRRNIQHYLPVINKNKLYFAQYTWGDALANNTFDICEPFTKWHFQTRLLSIILLPVVGYDIQGNRLGMGGGYYDCTLKFMLNANCKKRPLLVGIAYSLQCTKNIKRQSWDIPLDAVLTEQGVLHFSKRAKQIL